jgi:hypothetical protein
VRPAQRDAYWRGRGYTGPTPQTDPAGFTTAELILELHYLFGLDRRHGNNPLRAAAENQLSGVIGQRPDRPKPMPRKRPRE